MSAYDEYEIHKGTMTLQEMHRADAAIAELEAENADFERGARHDRDEIERLRVCGNCTLRHDSPPRISWDGHECGSRWNGVDGDWADEDNWPMVKCSDSCHFEPTRWAEGSDTSEAT